MTLESFKPDFVIISPLGKIGISMQDNTVTQLHFMPEEAAPTNHSVSTAVAAQLSAYFNDPAYHFDLPIQAAGTPFQQRVWRALRDIPCGTTVTYGELAKKLGSSPRAIGQACRKNPVPVIVPCHRVTSASGIGGYAGDTEGRLLAIKKWLLAHEAT